MSAADASPGALAPYRVLDLTTERSWLTGKLLADLGADVIKIEPPGGDPGRLLPPFIDDEPGPDNGLRWLAYNRGKRSIVADLETDAGRELLIKLVGSSHAVIESFDPGELERLGLGFDVLSAANPAIVLTRVTPFGQTGPYAHWAANDLAIAAAGGPASITGDPDRPPVRIAAPQYFHHAAAEAVVHTLVAIYHAALTGSGQVVDVAAQTAAGRTLMNGLHYAVAEGTSPPRTFFGSPTARRALPSLFRAADGWVTASLAFGPGLHNFRQWLADEGFPIPPLVAALREEEFTPTIFDDHPHELSEEFASAAADFFAARSKSELTNAAVKYRITLVPVNTTSDILADDQLAFRGYFTKVEHEGRPPITYPTVWAKLSGTPLRDSPRAPSIGAHDAEIREEVQS